MTHDETYLNVVSEILTKGKKKGDRTGVGTKSRFGCEMRFDLSKGYPLLTTKKVNFKAVINELIWMVVKGSTDVRWLQDKGHTFWNPWTLEDGTIGKGYGKQFRCIESIRSTECTDYTNSKGYNDLEHGNKYTNTIDSYLYKVWMGMFSKCYNKRDPQYFRFGADNVKVHDGWFSFPQFLEDAKQLSGFTLMLDDLDNFVLDNTLIDRGVFSKQSCQWVHKSDIVRNEDFQCVYQTRNLALQHIDQVKNLIGDIKYNPESRRMIVELWNVGDLPLMALPPCHKSTQWYVWRGKLSCKLYQRSADMFLGVPFNIAFYSAMVHMLCHLTGLEPGEFIWSGGDCHIYNNHFDAFEEQFTRVPFSSPTLTIAPDAPGDIDGDWKFEHFVLDNYESHGSIKADIAV